MTAQRASATGVPPSIEFRDVSVRFSSPGKAEVRALDRVLFSVPRGCFTSVIGPSGCGKTTLLRLASGLELPSRGTTFCNGEPVTGLNSQVGYITQDSNLYPWMTVRQNVEFPLETRGIARPERRERSDRYLTMVGLKGFEDHYPYQLSGGMQKRVSVVRTLIYEPETVLMDEPFGALDSQTRMALQVDLLKIWATREQTILFITHDLTEAIGLSDMIVVLSQRPGTVHEIFNIALPRPRDIFAIQAQPGFSDTYNTIWQTLRRDVLAAVGESDQNSANGSSRLAPGARPASLVEGAVASSAPAAEPAPAPTAAETAAEPDIQAGLLQRLAGGLLKSVTLYRILFLLVIFGAWELLADNAVIDRLVFSHPVGIVQTLSTLLRGAPIGVGTIYTEVQVTVSEMLVGFAIGGSLAIVIGFYLGRSRLVARVLQPFILASYGIPIIAVAPLFILVFGIGYPSKIGIATITAFFVVFFQTYAGVSSIAEEHIQLARIMGASRLRVARRIMIPASLPFIFIGLRQAVPFSMTGAVIGEFVASSQGLGWYIVRAAGSFDAAGLFSGLILMLVIVWSLGLVVSVAEGYFLRWQPSVERAARTAARGRSRPQRRDS